MSIMNLENKVKGIKPVEKTETKYFLGNMEITSNTHLQQIATKLSKDPSNTLTVEQIYMNLRSKLKTVTKNTLVPSNNFKDNLLEEKNNLILTKKDISSCLEEVRIFKQEFEYEYNDYLSTSEFYNYYSEIESLETKLENQNNKANNLSNTIDKSIKENDKKIAEIEKMNIEREKEKQQEEKEKQNQNKNKMQNNQQQDQNKMNMNDYMNYMNYMNQMYNYYEPEPEERKGRRM